MYHLVNVDIYKEIGFKDKKFVIISGCGNNGGDGLAIARLMYQQAVDVETYFCAFSENISNDCNVNFKRLKDLCPDKIKIISQPDQLIISKNTIIIDCLFGSGLTRPVTGQFAEIIEKVNNSENTVIAIDIPSGLFGEDNSSNTGKIIEADYTFTIQFPPLSSLFAENYKYFGDVYVVPIGLCQEAINETRTDYGIIDDCDIKQIIIKRNRFDHKGIFGHALLIAGSTGKAGAAVLASKACIRSGVGLLTVHVPQKLIDILQIAVPEAMVQVDYGENVFTGIMDVEKYSAIGIGPGLGTNGKTIQALKNLIKKTDLPIVIDADGLNILSEIKNFKSSLRPGTILTPHPKEFERLFGKFENSYSRINFMQKFSEETGVIIILKGGYTVISLPNKSLYFNKRGNPGMATGGSGDVLTGIISSLLAQSYSPEKAALAGVYIHSKAGDIAAGKYGQTSMIASDIVDCLADAFKF
ncbi:MAG: NAD(P)H-hydrate dehydratase [Bacteroidales bacterium]|nr:NAD(P)H-hydrate dehydratase [Bacteroidales bacterium]